MSPETQFNDPSPKSVGPQLVTKNPDGGWKSVIKRPDFVIEQPKDGNSGNGDWELRSRGAENMRRAAFLRRRMGLG